MSRKFFPLLLVIASAGCAPVIEKPMQGIVMSEPSLTFTEHRLDDDLLTAGLGLSGLRASTPPAFADPEHPTASELRRRTIWSNVRGIADLRPAGGYGSRYADLSPVPGREASALLKLPGASQPHRVLAQIPDAFDADARCLVVTAASGSRGVYGAVALASAWGLPKGCAVVHTDKGAGSDYLDATAPQEVTAQDGRRALVESGSFEANEAAFTAPGGFGSNHLLVKHAHSGDNPEADWGRHLKQAAAFGLRALAAARPDEAPFTFENTRVIAVGLSNGAAAVLRAVEEGNAEEGEWLDAALAIAPNVYSGQGGRAMFDYASEAALWMPCALLDARFDALALVRPAGSAPPAFAARCASLKAAGLLQAEDTASQAREALAHLHAQGWSDEAIEAGALNVAFDLWRSILVTYAAAYSRSGTDAMPCGYGFAVLDSSAAPRPTTAAERAAWWSDASGIPPGAGVALQDANATAGSADPAWAGLRCLRALWEGDDAAARRLHEGVAATRAALPRAGVPVVLLHGRDDGLIPAAFSGRAYANWAKAHGRNLRYEEIPDAQHFDAFLALPAWAGRYQPLLEPGFAALNGLFATITSKEAKDAAQ